MTEFEVAERAIGTVVEIEVSVPVRMPSVFARLFENC
jgi:hypothetical protein